MSFSEQIEEDDELLHVYEKMIFNTFHKRIKQLKQVNNKRYVVSLDLALVSYIVKIVSLVIV